MSPNPQTFQTMLTRQDCYHTAVGVATTVSDFEIGVNAYRYVKNQIEPVKIEPREETLIEKLIRSLKLWSN
jgi:hypothetical protein